MVTRPEDGIIGMDQSNLQAPDEFAPDYAPAILEHVLSRELCQRTIEVAERIGFKRSMVYTGPERGEDWPGYRNSESTYCQSEDLPEVYRYVGSVIQKMNNALYRFSLIGLEPFQVIRYGPGCFFNDHLDIGGGRAASRKLSLIIQLSDSDDYSGGDIHVFGGLTVPRVRGWGVVFPSWVQHRVNKIVTGTRYALVTWAIGNRFV
jgi:predicted 2-oxoglutarate/Fe(II)-dependent dioxygenase YbiX